MSSLAQIDPEIYAAIQQEEQRQLTKLELIASENFVSPAVLEAQGSILTHKYAEGYPGRRYYGGCEHVDTAETLAINRAKQLFGVEYVNVQPHSGTQANMAIYFAFLKPGDAILGMDLAHGGHLSHGAAVNFSGQLYRSLSYGVKKDSGEIDFEGIEACLKKHRPRMLVAGASAYPRTLDFERFAQLARHYGALLMVDIAHIAGLVAAGLHPSPTPSADFITSTTHKTLRGPRGGLILAQNREIELQGKQEFYAQRLDFYLFPGIQGGPLMHTIAAKAVAFQEALRPAFKRYQQQILLNARTMAEEFLQRGYKLVTGGTDNHLLLIDLSKTGLTGQQAEIALDQAGITVNKNRIPFDPRPAKVTSGIRIGTPALTTRGMKAPEMRQVVDFIHRALSAPTDVSSLEHLQKEVKDFCRTYPLFSPEWYCEVQ
ncbi:serine hydroxymethyltransferase [Desulfobacca acetoxidans]|uniref:Serine hydroxymethyltransferase n=1 Tax=Desulfobacca acetoxidans (strain ATCC 700848 / DSM 11109 / ASRB2) TaxID=880072 RepID=F2NG28_DESAR|nr:serine hydroxymethyltransferase [Desulfobacca acetoxidans]AEB08441.1 Glycine hydroxymethyltransferase [Desulfobacca acetoxidans DSM 11109]